jgi:hypothetical protein
MGRTTFKHNITSSRHAGLTDTAGDCYRTATPNTADGSASADLDRSAGHGTLRRKDGHLSAVLLAAFSTLKDNIAAG